ncbi:hypothetical protein SAMN05216218_1451 [Halorientalis regularis]|uniref:Uncharacterized protein n=1 Tax=Halorientalis regularis TaxID=660518 RepID=A0A1G7UAS2_9EURY|nr:hypothetical protein SAMN05216218_1451 [Halorientalis regularis]
MGYPSVGILLVVVETFDNLREGNISLNISDFDGNAFALFALRDNDDEPTLNASDAVTLVAEIFDFNSPLLPLFNGWCLWGMRGLGGSVCIVGIVGCRCGQHSHTIRFAGLELTSLNFLLWDFDNSRAIAFLDRRREQTAKLVRNIHQS